MRTLATISFFLACVPLLALIMLGEAGLAPMLHTPVWVAAMLRTLLIAEASVPIALVLSVPAALAIWGARLPVKRIVLAVGALPILLPPAWSAAGLQYAADRAGIPDAHIAALIAAHAVPATSLAFLVLYAVLSFADPALLRVAAANGASTFQAWRITVWSHLADAIVAAAAVAFAASVALTTADTALAPAYHPTLGAMLNVAMRTADPQAAPAALILALLALGPIAVVWCLAVLRRKYVLF